MKRRDFILNTAVAGLSGVAVGAERSAPTDAQKSLAQLFCAGGPDFRHLMAPQYSESEHDYGYHYWRSRASSFGVSNTHDDLKTWSDRFQSVEHSGVHFGFHPVATWLANEFREGRVAIINNVYSTKSRNHEHASRVFESGHHWVEPQHRHTSGWGGRLAEVKSESILSLSRHVRTFCYGGDASDPSSRRNQPVLSFKDSEQFGLFKPERLQEDPSARGHREVMSRALENYYKAKGDALDSSSPHYVFLQHEKNYRYLGEQVQSRLNGFNEEPFSNWSSGDSRLHDRGFELQMKSLFDGLYCRDLLNTSTMSLDYGGFDTHKRQASALDDRFSDLFAMGGGLDTFFTALRQYQPEVARDFVLTIGGEFGRQLSANGDGGTDHGRGNSMILIGSPIKGGVYGNMFPETEIENYSKSGKDIEGLTHVDHIFAKLCNWSSAESANHVFSQLDMADLEDVSVLDFI